MFNIGADLARHEFFKRIWSPRRFTAIKDRKMSKCLQRMIAALAFATVAPMASASVLNFDDLVGGPAFFTQNYQGFQFGTNDPTTTAWFYTDLTSPDYVPHSGTHYISTDFQLYNGGLNNPTQPISRTTPFVFNGAYFSGGGDTITYQLFLGNTLVYTSSASAPLTGTSTFFASGYSGNVTGVVIVGHQGFYALDDFTYDVVAAAVPEPETLPLLAAGLLCLGAAVRRRRR
jgi:PEP-CTERM motif